MAYRLQRVELQLCDRANIFVRQPQWNNTDHAERAIDQLPAEGNVAQWAKDQRERQDQKASYHSKFDPPNVFDGIAQRANKGNRNDDVRKAQPIRAVGHKWIVLISDGDGLMDCID